MPGRFAVFSIRLEGGKEAAAAIGVKREAILDAMYDSLEAGSLRIRGAVVASFGKPGFPRRGTGRLSRSVRSSVERSSAGALALVGIESKVPYARILEFGGVQPERTIRPVRKRALRWTGGMTRLGSIVSLDFGATRNQAFEAPKTRAGRKAEAGDTTFAKEVHQPSRFQRAIPYFGPSFASERGGIESDLRKRLADALRAT